MRIPSLALLATLLLRQPRTPLAAIARAQLGAHQDLLCQAALQPGGPSPCWCLGLFLPRGRTLHLLNLMRFLLAPFSSPPRPPDVNTPTGVPASPQFCGCQRGAVPARPRWGWALRVSHPRPQDECMNHGTRHRENIKHFRWEWGTPGGSRPHGRSGGGEPVGLLGPVLPARGPEEADAAGPAAAFPAGLQAAPEPRTALPQAPSYPARPRG